MTSHEHPKDGESDSNEGKYLILLQIHRLRMLQMRQPIKVTLISDQDSEGILSKIQDITVMMNLEYWNTAWSVYLIYHLEILIWLTI